MARNSGGIVFQLAAIAFLAYAQAPPPRPQFEAASIKRSSGAEQSFFGTKGLTFTSQNMPLRMMIAAAYGIQPSDISGGPGWINSDGYNIAAKRPAVRKGNAAETGEQEMHASSLMLRALLEDRCKLQFHWVTKEGSVYELKAAKGGMKLRSSACGRGAATASRGQNPLLCGESKIIPNGLISTLVGAGIGINHIAQWLTMITGRTVLDKTLSGFGGSYDVSLEFTPDSLSAAPADITQRLAPSIFTALREQLGLTLEPVTGPVRALVIDEIARPSEN